MKKVLVLFFILVFLFCYQLLSCPFVEWVKEEVNDWKNEEKKEEEKDEEEKEESIESSEEEEEEEEESYDSQDPADGDQLKLKKEC